MSAIANELARMECLLLLFLPSPSLRVKLSALGAKGLARMQCRPALVVREVSVVSDTRLSCMSEISTWLAVKSLLLSVSAPRIVTFSLAGSSSSSFGLPAALPFSDKVFRQGAVLT